MNRPMLTSDGVRPEPQGAKAVVHKSKAKAHKDKVINRDHYVKAMTNQHNIIFYDVNIYR